MSDANTELPAALGELALRTSLSQAVKHATNAVTGVPGLGDALGQATNSGYGLVPDEVKAGAGIGGVVTIAAGANIMSLGTAGSIAFGTAVFSAFLPVVAVGAGIGGLWWLAKKL